MKEIPIDLKQLRYFVHIAEFGSFTKAANFLDVAQPVLSRQIRKLEVDLGQNLLIRDGRGVSLTDSGAVLLEHSRGILHQLERAFEDVTRGQLSGHISMGLPPTLARIFSVPMTKDFHELLPDANLVITEKLSASIEEEIITGKLDMGVLHNPTRSPELDIFMLAKENLFLMAPKELKFKTTKKGVSLEEVSKLPLILPSYPNSYRLLVEMQMAKISAKPRVILEMNSVNTILELVAEGIGCAIFSSKTLEIISEKDRERLQSHCIHSPHVVSRIYMATSNKRIITKTQKTMLNIIRNLCDSHFNIIE